MFSELISRNSRRNRKENGLFFSSLLISVIAFYIILSLSRQDVMLFLAKMESNAVDRLLSMIPVFYGAALFILFFLIYYASRYQLERRRHEFGIYLMMGMRRGRLFVMLLAEDLRSSISSLAVGLPVALLVSELISLVTARLVGIGIVGHQMTFSLQAMLWTAAGFLFIKLLAFLILSGRISRQEISSLLVPAPEGAKKQLPSFLYALALMAGAFLLASAYGKAISGVSWYRIDQMILTLALGLSGTFLLFWGLRFPIGAVARLAGKGHRLQVFNFRQIEETVIHRSGILAVCSLLILAALCCFGAGVAISRFFGASQPHVLDYTFQRQQGQDVSDIRRILSEYGLDSRFTNLFEMRVGHVRTSEDDVVFRMEPLMDALRSLPASSDSSLLLSNLKYAGTPHLISLSGYNRLLTAAGLPQLVLEKGQAAVYMDGESMTAEQIRLLNHILAEGSEALLDQDPLYLTGTVQTTNLVTDRFISLSFALILPDEAFEYYTQGEYTVYLNGILSRDKGGSLISVISDMNERLAETGLHYESYLQNIGRQLFYMVAASYITIYLAIIFLIIANTIIGVQFLMGQRKSGRRYRTLIRLGADHRTLCRCARAQIGWYFGIPVAIAAFSSLIGVRALLVGLLPTWNSGNLPEMMVVSAAMIFALCVVEYLYMAAVKRSSDHYLLTLMVPEREE